ncbi:hypothetical protein WJX74_009686 [Apatococcus lobatus]|uniref:CS domain-containing protein n=1 Tax=Apatococcus lobatus TaxID=904363 RepID=A0AAW1RC20_9CHLO
MPLRPQLDWQDAESSLQITVRLPGISQSQHKLDLQLTEAFLKINRAPYLCFVDLFDLVIDSKSSAIISSDRIEFHLLKAQPRKWTQLEADLPKDQIVERRRRAVERQETAREFTRKTQKEELKLHERNITDQRMEMAQRKRDLIQKAKDKELAGERASITRWQSSAQTPKGAMPDHPHYYGRGKGQQFQQHSSINGAAEEAGAAWKEWEQWPQPSESSARAAQAAKGNKENNSGHTGAGEGFTHRRPPRSALQPVQVEFTALETPSLPAREMRELELKDYKRQIQEEEASKSDQDAVDVSETQPLFMKDKGDALARNGNHAGAVNAYTCALHLDPTLTLALSNRSCCHLALHHWRECIQDCTAALGQLGASQQRDHEEGFSMLLAKQQAKLFMRRASALVAGGNPCAAIKDLQQAVKLQPGDAALEKDMLKVQAAQDPSNAEAVRVAALACCKCQDWEWALQGFTSLLELQELDKDRLSTLANRSAAHLGASNAAACLQDCDAALSLLLSLPRDSLQGFSESLPALFGESSKLDAWALTNQGKSFDTLVRLLARRGAALGHLQRYNEAHGELLRASQLVQNHGRDQEACQLAEDAAEMLSCLSSSTHNVLPSEPASSLQDID